VRKSKQNYTDINDSFGGWKFGGGKTILNLGFSFGFKGRENWFPWEGKTVGPLITIKLLLPKALGYPGNKHS